MSEAIHINLFIQFSGRLGYELLSPGCLLSVIPKMHFKGVYNELDCTSLITNNSLRDDR
jgi:hypothetical protein